MDGWVRLFDAQTSPIMGRRYDYYPALHGCLWWSSPRSTLEFPATCVHHGRKGVANGICKGHIQSNDEIATTNLTTAGCEYTCRVEFNEPRPTFGSAAAVSGNSFIPSYIADQEIAVLWFTQSQCSQCSFCPRYTDHQIYIGRRRGRHYVGGAETALMTAIQEYDYAMTTKQGWLRSPKRPTSPYSKRGACMRGQNV